MTWDPRHYLQFADLRTRPAAELAQHVAVDAPRTVIDLGCGPGNSTQILRRRWPGASVSGMDESPEMIEAAREAYPDQEWILGDIATWSANEPFDVVFSNAALHWLPDHAALTRHLLAQVAPGGALAFQIPSGADSPLRAAIRDTADDPAWSSRMDAARAATTKEPPAVYYDALAPHARTVDIWETEVQQVMESPRAIVQWISSTGLRPYLDALTREVERQRFLDRFTSRIVAAYPVRPDGRTLFPFRRTFVVAYA